MRSIMLLFVLLPTSSTSLGALCSMVDVTFVHPMSPSGMFPSCAMMQVCMTLPN